MPASEQDDYLNGLQRMANQIADNFAGLPSERGATSIADHLQRFWDPGMRSDLVQAVSDGSVVVSDRVREAIQELVIRAEQ